MVITFLKKIAWYYPKSVFAALGLFWLVIEPIIGLTGNTINLSYWQLFGLSASIGVIWFILDGILFSGYLKNRIEITSNGFDTKIIIKFSDLFNEEGWKAIPVNDFFDSIVDDRHISSKSLHGILIKRYWGGNTNDWDQQVEEQLSDLTVTDETRTKGKTKRYKIGTAAVLRKDGDRFICVASTHTNISNLETKANTVDLHHAICGVLETSRSCCSNETLSIPLFGSGLSRIGLKNNILVDHILTAIFEESKKSKVTDVIQIILPKNKRNEINLLSIKRDWS